MTSEFVIALMLSPIVAGIIYGVGYTVGVREIDDAVRRIQLPWHLYEPSVESDNGYPGPQRRNISMPKGRSSRG